MSRRIRSLIIYWFLLLEHEPGAVPNRGHKLPAQDDRRSGGSPRLAVSMADFENTDLAVGEAQVGWVNLETFFEELLGLNLFFTHAAIGELFAFEGRRDVSDAE